MFEESFEGCWQQRYGSPAPEPVEALAPFLRHRSIRKYLPQPIPETVIAGLIAAAQSAATSSNLQLWSVISIQDPERREALAKLCSNQSQIRECPWFLTFFADHHRLRQAAANVGEDAAGLSFTEFLLMATIDASLAAERLVCAAEAMGLGICYIGALRNNPSAVTELLQLPEGVFGLFGLCLGYPDPAKPAEVKPRLPQPSVWFQEEYDTEASIGDYDDRMTQFYESQRMRGDVTWSMRSGRRVDRHHLEGREALKEWLNSIGMGVE